MSVFRVAILLALTAPCLSFAVDSECEDAFLECKDSCLIEFGGSVRLDQKKKYGKCMKKCTKVGARCDERATESRTNGLDDGALDNVPTSDEVDSNNMPTRTGRGEDTKPRKEKVVEAAPAAEPVDDAPPPKKSKAELTSRDVPKSDRTTLKTDDPPPSKPEPAAEPDEPPKKEVIEMKLTPKNSEPEEPAPAPKPKPKKVEPPPKKEDDHDDLRNY